MIEQYEVITSEQMMKLLNTWYLHIREENKEMADRVKEEVDEKIKRMEENQTLLLYYSLLEFRYRLLNESIAESAKMLETVIPDKLDNFLTYYYYFFKGMYEYSLKNYNAAVICYTHAEQMLAVIPDEIEKAEFHFQVAWAFSFIPDVYISLQHVQKAKAIFDTYPTYTHRQAECENLLGICRMLEKDFVRAEEHLMTALHLAQPLKKNDELLYRITKDIGYLYAEQGLSVQAIPYLESAYHKQERKGYKAVFLLARECFKIGDVQRALKWIDKGIKICMAIGEQDYLHHLMMIQSIYHSYDGKVILDGISYFQQKKNWAFAEEYARMYADSLHGQGRYEEACKYYQLALRADNKAQMGDVK
ncbi:hypothetical protein JQN58_18925 [Aneurinibacillus sp. BA2021]|nr:hypothetical protein [Aneurinibacillus sp. BA2021]